MTLFSPDLLNAIVPGGIITKSPWKGGSLMAKIYTDTELDFMKDMAGKLQNIEPIPEEVYSEYNVKRGLRNANGTGVVVGLTKVGEVIGYTVNDKKEKMPCEGKLYYRGYDIEDLVGACVEEARFGFEEITYLLLFGELPSKSELEDFKNLVGSNRELPKRFAADIMFTAPSPNLMNKLQRAILSLYSYDEAPDDTSMENLVRQSIELIGFFPTLVAYAYQVEQSYFHDKSLHLHYPVPELSTAENILRMIRPNGEYTYLEARILDLCLILHAEHGGGNNSTFTTHLVSSSGTDTYSAIAAAIGALKGPRHGGANTAVVNMIADLKRNVSDVSDFGQVEDYLVKVLKKEANDMSGLVYGMGHAIYTISDPRAQLLKDMARKLAINTNRMEDFMVCEYIENHTQALRAEITGNDKPMCANVDLYSGFVYDVLGIPTDLSTPLFANARLSGWCAHRLEEFTIGKKLMRPSYRSVEPIREYVPIKERGKEPEKN